jgi:hypothetical protein
MDKKEGKCADKDAWTRENRWNWYVEEQERKKKEEQDRKDNSMFKEYNEMFADKPVSSQFNQTLLCVESAARGLQRSGQRAHV